MSSRQAVDRGKKTRKGGAGRREGASSNAIQANSLTGRGAQMIILEELWWLFGGERGRGHGWPHGTLFLPRASSEPQKHGRGRKQLSIASRTPHHALRHNDKERGRETEGYAGGDLRKRHEKKKRETGGFFSFFISDSGGECVHKYNTGK